jgi:hypothetical protein
MAQATIDVVDLTALSWEHLKVADSSKGWMAAYMLQAVPKNIFATLRCSPLSLPLPKSKTITTELFRPWIVTHFITATLQ